MSLKTSHVILFSTAVRHRECHKPLCDNGLFLWLISLDIFSYPAKIRHDESIQFLGIDGFRRWEVAKWKIYESQYRVGPYISVIVNNIVDYNLKKLEKKTKYEEPYWE